jgi:ribonuclease J
VGKLKNRVAVACFASNVARVETIAKVAAAHDRRVALVGRSLWRIAQAAKDNGYLTDLPPFITEHDVGYLPREEVLMICTGSQGEPRSALTRIARGDHPAVTLEAGDAVIFSSRIIPGNEKPIGQLQNDLARLGVEIVTEKDHFVHVSGHPARDELIAMYQWVRPRIAIPVHGEARHLAAHARLAEECQVGQGLAVSNGALIQLRPGGAEILEHVHVGRIGLDGKALLPLDSEVMRVRHRTIWNGSAVVSLVINRRGELLGEPQITVHGLLNEKDHGGELAELRETVGAAVRGVPLAARGDDPSIKEAARIALRRAIHASHGKKPVTDVHLVRV